MRYFSLSFRLSLRAQLRRVRTWAAVVLVLACALALRLAPPSEDAMVTVGVVLPPEGGEAFWQGLTARETELISFVCTDAETMRRQVSASRWDCGLTLSEDFSQRLEDLDLDKAVTVTVGPGSTVYPLVQETAAAVLTALAAPKIAEEYLASISLAPGGAVDLPEVRRAGLSMRTLDGRPVTGAELSRSGRDNAALGVAAAFLTAWALFAAVDLGGWLQSGQARRALPCRSAPALALPRLLSSLALPLSSAAAALMAVSGGRSALSLLLYGASLAALALALCRFPPVWTALPALIPFASSSVLVLSPVFVDVGALVPRLAPLVNALPATWALRTAQGDIGSVLRLLSLTAALAAASFLPDVLRRGK